MNTNGTNHQCQQISNHEIMQTFIVHFIMIIKPNLISCLLNHYSKLQGKGFRGLAKSSHLECGKMILKNIVSTALPPFSRPFKACSYLRSHQLCCHPNRDNRLHASTHVPEENRLIDTSDSVRAAGDTPPSACGYRVFFRPTLEWWHSASSAVVEALALLPVFF